MAYMTDEESMNLWVDGDPNYDRPGATHVQYDPRQRPRGGSPYGVPGVPAMMLVPGQHVQYGPNTPALYGWSPSAALGDHPTDQKWGLILLVVGVGLLLYFLGRSTAPKSNPSRRRRRRQPRNRLGRFTALSRRKR